MPQLMKKRQSFYLWLWSLLTLCVTPSCDPAVNTDHAEVGAAAASLRGLPYEKNYHIDTSRSQVSWIGTKVTGRHNGMIPIRQGALQLQGNQVVSGRIVLDMQALRATDKRIDEANNHKLAKHLTSADFFDAGRFPDAVFELISIKPFTGEARQPAKRHAAWQEALRVKNPTHYLTGNLTIKGCTRSITFPARLVVEGDELRAQANFNIDRTHWGLVYGSDKSMGNKTIHPIVNVGLDVVAKP